MYCESGAVAVMSAASSSAGAFFGSAAIVTGIVSCAAAIVSGSAASAVASEDDDEGSVAAASAASPAPSSSSTSRICELVSLLAFFLVFFLRELSLLLLLFWERCESLLGDDARVPIPLSDGIGKRKPILLVAKKDRGEAAQGRRRKDNAACCQISEIPDLPLRGKDLCGRFGEALLIAKLVGDENYQEPNLEVTKVAPLFRAVGMTL